MKKALDSNTILVYSGTINMKKESYIMKKLILILAVLWLGLSAFANSVKANDSTQATVAHIITQKIQGNNVDTSVLEAEMSKLAYQFSLEMTDVIEKHLPNIVIDSAGNLEVSVNHVMTEEHYIQFMWLRDVDLDEVLERI